MRAHALLNLLSLVALTAPLEHSIVNWFQVIQSNNWLGKMFHGL